MKHHLKRLALERLMQYYRFLAALTNREPRSTITSAEIAKVMDIDPTQVRKDFAAIGLMGMGRVGFDVREICSAIRLALGFDQRHEAVLIGTGHLGGVLLSYAGFARYGLHILAAFDDGADVKGGTTAGHPVRPLKTMKSYVSRHKIRLAILAPPTEATQILLDHLVSAGVRAVWNFTPTQVEGPPGVLVRNEQHFSIGLSEIAYHLKR